MRSFQSEEILQDLGEYSFLDHERAHLPRKVITKTSPSGDNEISLVVGVILTGLVDEPDTENV